jgi:putative transposase
MARADHAAVSPDQSPQKFASAHASVLNHFNRERGLYSRSDIKLNRAAVLAEWRPPGAA